MKKIFLTVVTILILFNSYSQSKFSAKTGQTSLDELKMKIYAKDSSAVAVVLYEQSNTYMNPAKNYDFSTDFYYRIKILKKEGFEKGTVKIIFHEKESIDKIEAYTYNIVANSIQKKHLLTDDIFKNNETNKWKSKSFTLPDIKIGSVIEYKYTITSPFLQLDDWYFQSDIPKMNSEYHSSIIGNYQYNVSLKGYLKLDKNNPSVIKRCHKMPGYKEAGCNVLDLGIRDIPAFKEESYMTNSDNFISRVAFELHTVFEGNGNKIKYTDTWKSADSKFKSGDYFGAELRRSSFFKKNLPAELKAEAFSLEKATNIFYYIQKHYTNNNKNITYSKINTKKTFEAKSGSSAEINIALMNALKATGFDAKIALLTTRNRAKPTKLFPVISEFNYLIVKLTFNEKDYFLDASDKLVHFGLTPFNSLNGEVRVMDFKKGSYWQQNSPTIATTEKINLNIKITDDGAINGKLRVAKTGYNAYFLRNKLKNKSEDTYLETYENDNQMIVNNYKIKGATNKEAATIQTFDFNLEQSDDNNTTKLYLNPFFHEAIKINPFKLEERLYPVDFGYKLNYSYRANITVPEKYTIQQLPKSKGFSLPNNGGKFLFNIKKVGSKISIYFMFQLNKTQYSSEEYFSLKEFFNQIIKAQTTLITLEKK